ncbi:MAG: hypothetical protein KKF74_02445 [Nanoarchaeota archaeon]|nr:hypothetical protein [Nanoarchaeota archaeon]
MDQIKQNIINSFRLAKSDIIETKQDIIELGRTMESIIERLSELKTNQARITEKIKAFENKASKKAVKKVIIRRNTKKAHKIFVAPKEGKVFHLSNCPFAQNIKPKNKVNFKSKTKALNEGFKPCKCIK